MTDYKEYTNREFRFEKGNDNKGKKTIPMLRLWSKGEKTEITIEIDVTEAFTKYERLPIREQDKELVQNLFV